MNARKDASKSVQAGRWAGERFFAWNPYLRELGPRYAWLLLACVALQLLAISWTWPTWNIRTDIVNLPWSWSQWLPQFSMGWPLVVSLLAVALVPGKRSLVLHLGVLVYAMLLDQFRCQPQFIGVTVALVACVLPISRSTVRWYFVSMWLWAGIHKLLSPDWFGNVSVELLRGLGESAFGLVLPFACLVVAVEIGQGLLAIARPRAAVATGIALHFGILVFLVSLRWNPSVWPWNVVVALVGSALFWDQEPLCRLDWPRGRWLQATALAVMVLPAGFYLGWVRHTFAHVLYSSNVPLGVITRNDGLERLEGITRLGVAFPHSESVFKAYFEATSGTGDKLHILPARRSEGSKYFVIAENGKAQSITPNVFFDSSALVGVAFDDPRAGYQLGRSGVRMVKRTLEGMIYAVEIEPEQFSPHQLEQLAGLPNLEQIQLNGCPVNDEQLASLPSFPMLTAIGLQDTEVSAEGLHFLGKYPRLNAIEFGSEVFHGVDQIPAPSDP